MSTNANTDLTKGIDVKALLAELADLKAKAETPAQPASVETRKGGKVVHTTPTPKAVGINNSYGSDYTAAMDGAELVLRLAMVAASHVSSTGNSRVHQTFTVQLSDGSRVTGSRYTPIPKAQRS